MLVDCALIVSSADRFRITDTAFDHGECVNAITTTSTSVLTADQTAAIVLCPRGSHLDSQTTCHNLIFLTALDTSVIAVLLSPPTWKQTLRLDGPSFTAIRSQNSDSSSSSQRMRFVMLLVAGRMALNDFESMSVVILRDPVVGLDHRSPTLFTTHVVPWTDLWQDMTSSQRIIVSPVTFAIIVPSLSAIVISFHDSDCSRVFSRWSPSNLCRHFTSAFVSVDRGAGSRSVSIIARSCKTNVLSHVR